MTTAMPYQWTMFASTRTYWPSCEPPGASNARTFASIAASSESRQRRCRLGEHQTTIDKHIEKHGIDAPSEARYVPVWVPGNRITSLDLRAAGVTSAIWCMGFHADYRWIDVPIFDGRVTRRTSAA